LRVDTLRMASRYRSRDGSWLAHRLPGRALLRVYAKRRTTTRVRGAGLAIRWGGNLLPALWVPMKKASGRALPDAFYCSWAGSGSYGIAKPLANVITLGLRMWLASSGIDRASIPPRNAG